MLTLYYKQTCPYSQNVLAEAETMGVHFNLKDIGSDMHLLDELIQKGGQRQTPFLIDTDKGVMMYESEAIIAHLKEHYNHADAPRTFGGLRVHQSDEICDSCQ
jgi:glutathione S-transferase